MESNAVVLAVKNRKAVILASGGIFKEIADQDYFVGQKITWEKPRSSASVLRRGLMIAACLVLLLTSCGFAAAKHLPWTVISVARGETTVRYHLNAWNEVLSAEALAGEGKAVLEAIEAASYEPLNAVIERTFSTLNQAGEGTDEIPVSVEIASRFGDGKQAENVVEEARKAAEMPVRVEKVPWQDAGKSYQPSTQMPPQFGAPAEMQMDNFSVPVEPEEALPEPFQLQSIHEDERVNSMEDRNFPPEAEKPGNPKTADTSAHMEQAPWQGEPCQPLTQMPPQNSISPEMQLDNFSVHIESEEALPEPFQAQFVHEDERRNPIEAGNFPPEAEKPGNPKTADTSAHMEQAPWQGETCQPSTQMPPQNSMSPEIQLDNFSVPAEPEETLPEPFQLQSIYDDERDNPMTAENFPLEAEIPETQRMAEAMPERFPPDEKQSFPPAPDQEQEMEIHEPTPPEMPFVLQEAPGQETNQPIMLPMETPDDRTNAKAAAVR